MIGYEKNNIFEFGRKKNPFKNCLNLKNQNLKYLLEII